MLMLEDGEEDIVIIQGRAFVVKPATEADVERIGKGFFWLE
jgi:hypothetical protein